MFIKDPLSHLQACAEELRRGANVWQEVIANSAQETFTADPQGAAYLQALQHMYRVALLLQQAAKLQLGNDPEEHDTHFALASQQSIAAVQGRLGQPSCQAEKSAEKDQNQLTCGRLQLLLIATAVVVFAAL